MPDEQVHTLVPATTSVSVGPTALARTRGDHAASGTISHHLRLKRPCPRCPFRKEGAIELRPGRVAKILDELMRNDHATFYCHETAYARTGGSWDEEGNYVPSGCEAMCAGAAAALAKRGRPTVAMRIAVVTGAVDPDQWRCQADQVL